MPATRRGYLTMWAVGLLGLLLADGPVAAQRRDQTLVVSALDRDTLAPVRDLTSRDVVVREDGVAREVLRVSRLETPMHLAILVDDSSAARLHTSRLREGLSRFVRALDPAHEISLVTYANRPTLVVSFSRDRTALEAGVERLFPTSDSGAYLLDALEETANGFIKRESARPVIVVVDVLGEPLSYATYDRVLDRLLKSGAQLHVVQVAEPSRSTSQESIGRSIVIDEGTRTTGGRRIDLLASTALPDALASLAAELEAQYRVVYSRPESLIPPREVKVSSAIPTLSIRGTVFRTPE